MGLIQFTVFIRYLYLSLQVFFLLCVQQRESTENALFLFIFFIYLFDSSFLTFIYNRIRVWCQNEWYETCCKHESYAMLDAHHTQTHCSRINNDLLRFVKNWIVTLSLWSIIDSEKHNKMTAYSYSMHSFIDENRLHMEYVLCMG